MGIFENAFPEYVIFSQLDKAVNWARKNSVAYLAVNLDYSGVELTQVSGGRFDIERFGAVPQISPRHADLMIIAGAVTYKMASRIRQLYEQMPFPKYVMSMGSSANCGGLFSWEYSYSVVSGLDKVIPVDVFVPGDPPRPEAVLHGLITLQRKIATSRALVREETFEIRKDLGWPLQTGEIIQKIEENFGSAVVAAADEGSFPHVQIKPDKLLALLELCACDPAFSMDFLECITAVDNGEDFILIYHLNSIALSHRINIKVALGRHSPRVATATRLWPGAKHYEHEASEMFGIGFEGNERGSPFLLAADWRGYPLRKDYVYPEEYQGIEHRRAPLRKEHLRP